MTVWTFVAQRVQVFSEYCNYACGLRGLICQPANSAKIHLYTIFYLRFFGGGALGFEDEGRLWERRACPS